MTGLRLPLLAMTLPSMLDFTELPEAEDQRVLADEQLRQTLAALDEDKRIDLLTWRDFRK